MERLYQQSLAFESAPARSLLNAVNRASDAATSAWLVYLGLCAYFIVALAGLSHKELLLNSPITLPILGIFIALDRFFLFAPPLFILVHAGMMMLHAALTKKIYAFKQLIEEDERRLEAEGLIAARSHPLRYELSSNIFTQFLAGPRQAGVLVFLQQLITWVTLIVLAAIVLIFFQIAYLPYHDPGMTWAHRLYVIADLALVALIGTFLPSPLTGFWASLWYSWRTYPVFMLITAGFFACFFAFSLFVATVPGEKLDRALAEAGPSAVVEAPSGRAGDARRVFLPTAVLFEGAVDPETGRGGSPFQRNLIVMDQDLTRSDGARGESSIGLTLRYRDLRYARLDRSNLSYADMTGADLTGASLNGAVLTGARLTNGPRGQ